MPEWSDGVPRPDWWDGDALTRGIEDYFAKPRDEEIARLRIENAAMRSRLGVAAKKGSRVRDDSERMSGVAAC
jgi:PleD family two-component response regulator